MLSLRKFVGVMLLKIKKVKHVADATLLFNRSELHATPKSKDMYFIIDLLINNLAHQLSKYKKKLKALIVIIAL
ncbi:MAG: HPF/RaiA family ribosome-associated protein [Candidatus Malihini olakiniferum]